MGYGLVDAYQALLLAQTYPHIVNTSQTWSNTKDIFDDIIINAGATLTITGTILIAPNKKIIVLPGGKLVLDGGKISKLHSNAFWNGILVVGNKNQRQLPQYQGIVETKNGAIIEYSKNAICTWNGTDYTTTGGIVKVSNTNFLNNIKSIEFKEYTNHNIVGNITNNVSYIRNCNFTIDDWLLSYSGNYLDSHIIFQGIRGVKISGSSFKNESTNQKNIGDGIRSISSGFIVTESCSTGSYLNCNCTGTTINSDFSSLYSCIKVLNDGNSSNTITINNTEFEDFLEAINIAASNNFQITQSSFKLKTGHIYGIKLSTCTGYKIEENNFFSNYNFNPTNSIMKGIHVYNSGINENLIYRNNFSNIYNGITTTGINGKSFLPYSGLQFKCNTFQNTFHSDIYCNSIIRRDQGSNLVGADNKFMKGICLDDYYLNFHYPSDILQVMYFYSSNYLHDPTTTTNVYKINSISSNNCASTLCDFHHNIGLSGFEGEGFDNFTNNDNTNDIEVYESLYNTYHLLVSNFVNANYNVLVENNFDNVETEIVDIINQDLDSISNLSFLMKELSDNNIYRLMVDSIFDIYKLNDWYQKLDGFNSKYFLTNNYFDLKEFENAWSILDNIPLMFDLSLEELHEYNNFRAFNSFRENVFASDRNYWQLDSVEIDLLSTIAANSNGYSGELSKNILCFYHQIGCPDENISQEDNIIKKSIANIEPNINSDNTLVHVFPNPAKETVNIIFNSTAISNANIEFFDLVGYKVLSKNLNSQDNIINLNQLLPGVYHYTIYCDKQIIYSGKLIKE